MAVCCWDEEYSKNLPGKDGRGGRIVLGQPTLSKISPISQKSCWENLGFRSTALNSSHYCTG